MPIDDTSPRRPIAEKWATLQSQWLTATTPPDTRLRLRTAFYVGAEVCVDMLMDALKNGSTEAELLELVQDIKADQKEFVRRLETLRRING